MGTETQPQTPIVVEVEVDNPQKNIEQLDVELPVLAPRIYREYKNLAQLNLDAIAAPKLPVTDFSEEQKREIIFKEKKPHLPSGLLKPRARKMPTISSNGTACSNGAWTQPPRIKIENFARC